MGYDDEHETIAALLGARQALYALLARCWDAPLDAESLSLLGSADLEALCQLLDGGADGDGDGGTLDEARAALAAEAEAAGVEQVQRAFNWCFIGIGTRVAPWESVYVSPDHLVFQASTLAVRDAYGEAGFVARRKGSEPDDHIATECDFMAKLAARARDAYEAGAGRLCRDSLSLSEKFLRDHLSVLNRSLGERIDEATAEVCPDEALRRCVQGVYGGLARFGQGFLAHDERLLKELSGAL